MALESCQAPRGCPCEWGSAHVATELPKTFYFLPPCQPTGYKSLSWIGRVQWDALEDAVMNSLSNCSKQWELRCKWLRILFLLILLLQRLNLWINNVMPTEWSQQEPVQDWQERFFMLVMLFLLRYLNLRDFIRKWQLQEVVIICSYMCLTNFFIFYSVPPHCFFSFL